MTTEIVDNSEGLSSSQTPDDSANRVKNHQVFVNVTLPKTTTNVSFTLGVKPLNIIFSSQEQLAWEERLSRVCRCLNWECYEGELRKQVHAQIAKNPMSANIILEPLEHLVTLKHINRVKRRIDSSGLPEALMASSFDLSRISFSDNFDLVRHGVLEPYENLFIRGEPGLGKTMTAIHYAKRAIQERGYSIFFIDSTKLIDGLNDALHGKALLEKVKQVHLLIIDDVGHEEHYRGNTVALRRVLDYRLKKPRSTIITSSVSIAEWEKCFDNKKLFYGVINRFISRSYTMLFTGISFYQKP